ncbi:hypothetical protein CC2G_014507 [Coprinopsis cinerea AmutBmut pab1-1]|nr:hypothetical protein CC2G_014507 [Coprinopsis cinerea AmutBmut pab1-1]
MAEAANTAGEELFRRCDFLGAQKRFSEASKLAPREPKYALNLAKAFFEQGKYEACVKTARVAWQKISPKAIIDSNDIAVQVASLYARARIYDAYRRRLDSDGDSASTNSPPTQVQVNAAQEKLAAQIASAIEGFIERGLEGDNPVFDASFGVFWRQFRNVEEERTEEEKEKVVKAGRHLWSIPILKAELHKNAHLRKFEAEPFYSITENLIVDINTKDASGLPIEKRNGRAVLVGSSAILIAGFGDGRNVLGNIIIHGKFLKDVTSMGRSGLRASERTLHVTAVEIEPALVSRFLITLWLLERLQEKKRAKEEKGVSEIVATLLFLHTTLIMPGYCADWVQQAIDALLALLAEGRTHLFSSIHISASSIEPITYFLRLWSTVRSLRTVKDFLASNPISDRHPVKRLPEKPSALLAKGVKGVDQRPGSSEPIYNDVDKELVECHLKLRVLFPPKNLLGRHPAVAKFVKCRGVPSRELAMAAEDEIETTWAVNVTLFDPLNLVDDSTEPYPRVTDNPFDALFRFLTKTREAVKDKQMSPGKTAIAIATNWFMLASDVMAWWGEKLTVEILVGDVYRAMPLLVEGDLGPRPEGFPRKYMRVGMNTLPDQNQGLIPIATSILPFVDVVDKAEVMMDTDMRPGDKRVSVAHFYYQHTLLQARDIPKFLGLTVFYNPNDVNNIPIYFRPPQLPRPLKELASKDALINWLTALLFAIISDGQADAPPNDQTTSLTLGGFFELLVHLHRVGFPGHWMGDFVGDLVEGRIETRVRPYHGTLPREICEHGCEPPRVAHTHTKSHRPPIPSSGGGGYASSNLACTTLSGSAPRPVQGEVGRRG